MKNLFISLLFILLSVAAVDCQDLIVTNEDDSLNCKITKETKEFIYFTFKHKDEIRSTLLPFEQVKFHQKDFFSVSMVEETHVLTHDHYKKFRFAINTGYSYETAKVSSDVPPDFRDYVKKLKSGFHIGGDASYFITEPLGIGFKYNIFMSSNEIERIWVEDFSGNRSYGKMSDDVKISFIGPMVSARLLNYKKTNAFLVNIALGYMGYRNQKVIVSDYTMTGQTFGLLYELGYDIELSKDLSFGFQVSWIQANLYQYEWDDGKTVETISLEDEYEGLSRFDFSVGIRF